MLVVPKFRFSGRPDFRQLILKVTLPFEVVDINKLVQVLAPEDGVSEMHCKDVSHAVRLLLESGDLYHDNQGRLIRVRKNA